jgi:hypothetical protein
VSDREPIHGIHDDDGTGEFTATVERAGPDWALAYLRTNGYLKRSHFRRRGQDAKLRRRAAYFARVEHRTYLATALPEELAEQT